MKKISIFLLMVIVIGLGAENLGQTEFHRSDGWVEISHNYPDSVTLATGERLVFTPIPITYFNPPPEDDAQDLEGWITIQPVSHSAKETADLLSFRINDDILEVRPVSMNLFKSNAWNGTELLSILFESYEDYPEYYFQISNDSEVPVKIILIEFQEPGLKKWGGKNPGDYITKSLHYGG